MRTDLVKDLQRDAEEFDAASQLPIFTARFREKLRAVAVMQRQRAAMIARERGMEAV